MPRAVASSRATPIGRCLRVRSASPAIGDGRTYRQHFDLADDLQARREQFLGDPNVAFIEPNYLLTMDAGPTGPLVPNDENYKQQWGPPKVGADQTWNTATYHRPRTRLLTSSTKWTFLIRHCREFRSTLLLAYLKSGIISAKPAR